jgi:hypothetical protein
MAVRPPRKIGTWLLSRIRAYDWLEVTLDQKAIGTCPHCHFAMLPGDRVDRTIYSNANIAVFDPHGTVYWERKLSHAPCAALCRMENERIPSIPKIGKKLVKRRNRSAQTLLLLLELGLPGDLAWPIAAVACWLL